MKFSSTCTFMYIIYLLYLNNDIRLILTLFVILYLMARSKLIVYNCLSKEEKCNTSLVKNAFSILRVDVAYLYFYSTIHTRFKLFIKTKNLNVLC